MAEVQPANTPDRVFICHNKADKNFARSLATALVEQGVSVWFDEWNLRPGDSISGGIERGISESDVFAVVWSVHAQSSTWVDAEWRAAFARRIQNHTIRVVPILLDSTPLPPLLADTLGIVVAEDETPVSVAAQMVGDVTGQELARRLQERFFEMLDQVAGGVGPWEYRLCPQCGSTDLKGSQHTDYANDRQYVGIKCRQCGWKDGSEV